MDFKTEIFRSVQTAIDRKLYNYKADRTYKSVVEYDGVRFIILDDDSVGMRAVPCPGKGYFIIFISVKADRTYKSVVKNITAKGYVILDETGNERIVKCAIPGLLLHTAFVSVWAGIVCFREKEETVSSNTTAFVS